MSVQAKEDELLEELRTQTARLYKAVLENATFTARQRGFEVSDWDALYVLFAQQFSWTPAQVRSLSIDEISMMMDAFFPAKVQSSKSRS